VDWDHPVKGHITLDISPYAAGEDIVLKFRMVSDGLYSAQDQQNNQYDSVKDGAWELDNIEIKVNDIRTWIEDCEGADTWTHEPVEPDSQTGVYYKRGQYYVDFDTDRPLPCEDRDVGEWMYAAVSEGTGKMVDDQETWLVSPAINVSGYQNLVGQWDQWVDLPKNSYDRFNLFLASSNYEECTQTLDGMVDEETGGWYGGPFWGVWTDDWSAFAGNEWLAVGWQLYNYDTPTDPHMGGVFLNRQRVGATSPNPKTVFNRDDWEWFHDWFKDELETAVTETARVLIRDADGIASLTLMASRNGGPYEAYACAPEYPPDPEWWKIPPPANQMLPYSEIHYYLEAMDTGGNVTTLPSRAPDTYYEMSILPTNVTTTTENPGILLVDKHNRRVPSRERDYRHSSEYYYREALGILGHNWETWDVDVESGSRDSRGPDTLGMKYYHTQIWWAHDFDSYVMWAKDQYNLRQWLQEGSPTIERNLLLSGLDISWELKSNASAKETLGFHDIWLSASYEGEVYGHSGASLSDTTAGLQDHSGGWTFMDYDDGECILATACPDPVESPDKINIAPGSGPDAEVVADYIHDGCATVSPAGVAYTNPTLHYQTIILGFGLEHMMDGVCGARVSNYTPEGYYKCGLQDRLNLMANIMGDVSTKAPGYFNLEPEGVPTDVVDGGFKNALSNAYPNPFNPVTEIAFSIKEAGPVTIEVYNVAGKVVRTLLNTEFDAPTQETVTWDGSNDQGERCASGVYFYRINAPGYDESRKMVMLK